MTKMDLLSAAGGIFCILTLSSLIVYFLGKKNPEKDYSELSRRIKSWWAMAIIFSLAVMIGRGVSIFFFAILSFLALKEFLSLVPTRRADHRVLFWCYLSIPLQYYWIGTQWYGLFVVFVPVYMFLLIPMRMVAIGNTVNFLRAAGTLHWGVMVTVYCLGYTAYLMMLPTSPVEGAGLVFFLVVLTQFNDVAQYLWGKSFGRTPVVPKVSPNKTLEGLLGGMFTTVLLSIFLGPWLTPMGLWHSALAGLLIGFFGFIGDITISALKRDLNIKDSGSMLPGHGGILDRVDSLTYSAPLFFHFIRYMYY